MHHLPVRATLRPIVALALLIVLLAPVAAAESILSFSASITLLANGSVDVTETIEVRAEGDQIRRGIFRDIPTVMENDDGARLRSNLNVVSVKRDGAPEPFFTQSIRDGTRIYAGEEDVMLATGVHTYEIRYTMTRMARRFADHDELYWNATGNFWALPIREAVAQVTLPPDGQITELNAYTGRFGASGSDVRMTRTADNAALFRATRPLSEREGMTIAVLFEKGALVDIGPADRVRHFLSDRRGVVFPLFAVFIVLLYNAFAWDAVGRDPRKGVIIPLFHPPKGFSPALVHYVHAMGWKKSGWTAVSAALVSLAVKKHVEIATTGNDTRLTAAERPRPNTLPPGEAVVEGLIRAEGAVTIDKTHGKKIGETRTRFIKAIEEENREAYFRHNHAYVIGGGVLAVALLFGLVFIEALQPLWLILSVAGGIVLALITSAFGRIWKGASVMRFVVMAWILVTATNIISASADMFSNFSINTGAVAAITIVAVTLGFAILMRAPTVQGRKVMDEIEGFRMYLETAEKERLNFVHEPEFSIARFESMLPYAMALGVEAPWAERLEGELARNALPESRTGYHPGWYHGGDFASGHVARRVSGIASGMSAAMVAAQPVSASSSGGGGGGFSGGGGGGGGGGGW